MSRPPHVSKTKRILLTALACEFALIASGPAPAQAGLWDSAMSWFSSLRDSFVSWRMGKGTALRDIDSDPMRRDSGICKTGYVMTAADTAAMALAKTKVKHVVIMMMENRSFDHYLSKINKYKVATGDDIRVPASAKTPAGKVAHEATVASDTWTVEGIPHHRAPLPCTTDLGHEWWAIHYGWNGGAMNKFVSATQFYTNEGQPNPVANEIALRDGSSPFLKKTIAAFSRVFTIWQGAAGTDAMVGTAIRGVETEFEALKTNTAVVNARTVFATKLAEGLGRMAPGKSADDLPVSSYMMSGAPAMQYFDWRELPFYYELAATFPIGDKYFSPVLGPTFINRNYLYGATSRSLTFNNTAAGLGAADAVVNADEDKGSLPEALAKAGISHGFYVSDHTSMGIANPYRYGSWLGLKDRLKAIVGKSRREFFDLAAAGTLPKVSFVDADIAENSEGEDEHPPGDVQVGQHLAWEVVRAVMTSPAWKDTVLFITYDENGGFADSVAPEDACEPGTSPQLFGGFYAGADLAASKKFKDDFDKYGVRVPLYVVSPYAKAGGYVSKKTYDHTSIVKFVENLFLEGATLTSRDKAADPMMDFFDFAGPDAAAAATFKGAFATVPPGAFRHSYADEDDTRSALPQVPLVPYHKVQQVPIFSRGPYRPVTASTEAAATNFAKNPFPEPTVDLNKYLICQALLSAENKYTSSWPTDAAATTMIGPPTP